jgi:ATP-dependent exoDNAse (exonuclease V) alpha subunit
MTQAEALEILKMGHNVFLTGAAGSGKTFLLNQYIRFLKSRRVGVGITASTGIAATHMGGRTIHSWCGIGIKDRLSKSDLRAMLDDETLLDRFNQTSVLVIDEVSMLHSFRLDLVDQVCRTFKNNDAPFGGMQIILCGDFFQLPPVSRDAGGKNDFAFKSAIWQKMNIKICYLDEQHRQADGDFLQILNNLRTDSMTEDDFALLNERINAPSIKSSTKLYTHNADVDAINNAELQKIKGDEQKYEMRGSGQRNLVKALKDSCLAPEELVLKKGAVVMFVKNNFEKGYVNGTLGEVIDFNDDGLPIVLTKSGREITAESASWVIEEGGEALARVMQIPLRLAWAITVHKSQGMSLDAAQIDLSKSFEYGMGYVALSRVKSLQGLKLTGMNEMALKVNPEVAKLDKRLIEISQAIVDETAAIDALEKEAIKRRFLQSVAPPDVDIDVGIDEALLIEKEVKKREEKISTYQKTKDLLTQKKTLEEIAGARGLVTGTIIGHIEKMLSAGEEIDIEYLKPEGTDFEKIIAVFKKAEDGRLAPIYEFFKGEYSFDDLRFARLFVDGKNKFINLKK